jgi:hypothetical protein
MGTRKPNAVMLSAIWRICFFECVRALRALAAHMTISHIVQFAALGIAEVILWRASPAGLMAEHIAEHRSGAPVTPPAR